MSPKKALFASALFMGLLAAGASHAQEVGYGTNVRTGTAGNCPSFCTGNEFASQEDGGAGLSFAVASESTYAIARGSSAFASGQSYLPELKGYAAAGLGKRGSVSSFASQLFTYTGSETRSVSLQVDLTGSVFNNASGYSFNSIGAQIAVVRGPDLQWYPSFGTLIFEGVSEENRLALGDAFINTPGVTSAQTTLLFDLQPGETFYVVTQLDVSSQNGIANAENTLKMSFDNATNLVAITSVPEVGTAWMVAAGLLVLGWGARRRRQAA
jgi:hypothetical protein